jgi:hypothetical protein
MGPMGPWHQGPCCCVLNVLPKQELGSGCTPPPSLHPEHHGEAEAEENGWEVGCSVGRTSGERTSEGPWLWETLVSRSGAWGIEAF